MKRFDRLLNKKGLRIGFFIDKRHALKLHEVFHNGKIECHSPIPIGLFPDFCHKGNSVLRYAIRIPHILRRNVFLRKVVCNERMICLIKSRYYCHSFRCIIGAYCSNILKYICKCVKIFLFTSINNCKCYYLKVFVISFIHKNIIKILCNAIWIVPKCPTSPCAKNE